MFKFIFFISVIITVQLNSQEFGIGTKWIYEQIDFVESLDDYQLLMIEKDTLIHGLDFFEVKNYYLNRVANKIDTFQTDRFFIRQDMNTIFLYHQDLDSIFTIYNFDLMVGESYDAVLGLYPWNQSFTIEATLDSITSEIIESRTWFYHHFQSSNSSYFISPIIKGIGGSFFIFPTFGAEDPPSGGRLLCFENGVDYYPSQLACDLVLPNQKINIFSTTVYPNPASERVYFKTKGIVKSELFDLQGRMLIQQTNQNFFNIVSLESGCYFIKLYDKQGSIFISKIVRS